jgi:ABC-2 type transport system permease protein
VVAEKMAALALQAAALAGVVFVAVFVAVGSGIFFELTFSTVTIAATTAAVTLMAIDFGLIAMAVGAFTGNRGFAVGVTAALAAASHLVSSLAPVVSSVAPARYLSLFYWAIGDNQLEHGVIPVGLGVLIGTAAAAGTAVIVRFDRHDLRA